MSELNYVKKLLTGIKRKIMNLFSDVLDHLATYGLYMACGGKINYLSFGDMLKKIYSLDFKKDVGKTIQIIKLNGFLLEE